jgi:hypothetical protein
MPDFNKQKIAMELVGNFSTLSQDINEFSTTFLLRAFKLQECVIAATKVESHS